MACPACGGTERQLLAPGYYRCTSVVTIVVPGFGPGGRPVAEPHARVCDTTYQEGFGGVPCAEHSLYSIGVCRECKAEPICGDCAGRTCLRCRRKQEKETADAAAARAAEIARVAAVEAAMPDVDYILYCWEKGVRGNGEVGAATFAEAMRRVSDWDSWPVRRGWNAVMRTCSLHADGTFWLDDGREFPGNPRFQVKEIVQVIAEATQSQAQWDRERQERDRRTGSEYLIYCVRSTLPIERAMTGKDMAAALHELRPADSWVARLDGFLHRLHSDGTMVRVSLLSALAGPARRTKFTNTADHTYPADEVNGFVRDATAD